MHNCHHLERQAREITSDALREEEVSSALVSSLLVENQFHVQIDTSCEEDTHQIAAYSLQPVIWEPPLV